MNKTDMLIDAIGNIDEKYLESVHEVKKPKKSRNRKWLAVGIAATMFLAIPLPVATAMGVDTAYDILYTVSPKIAQTFKPVMMSCEDNGVTMTLISSEIKGDTAKFYIAMQGDMLDETVDLYDSYYINSSYDSIGHVSFSDFDESTKTAYFLTEIQSMNGEKIPDSKITFSVREMIFDKVEKKGIIEEIDLSSVPKEVTLTDKININGHGVNDLKYENLDFHSEKCLVSAENPILAIADDTDLTGLGYVDGALHVQMSYNNHLKTDSHGYIQLSGNNGTILPSYHLSFWSDTNTDTYCEYVFPIAYEELKNYQLYGEFFTSKGHINGDWEITFPVK